MLEVALATWGLASEASPSEGRALGPSFSLVYEGSSDCPSRASFEAAILARAPSARADHDGGAEVRFEVELRPAPGQKRRLRAALRDGTSQDREIDADDCAEAVQSMAVIAAMILSSREAEAKPEPAAEEPAPPRTEPETPPPEPPPPKRAAAPTAPKRAAAPTASRVRPPRPTWLAAGAGLGLEGAAAPDPTYAASAFVELGSVTSGVLAPSLRVTALVGQAPDASTPGVGDARFRLLLGRVHGCGLRLGAEKLQLRLCAVVEGGSLFARGIDALNERSDRMNWLGAGLGAIGTLRLGARWALELAGGARGMAVRDEFVFAPVRRVHQVPVIAWDFRLGVAYRAW